MFALAGWHKWRRNLRGFPSFDHQQRLGIGLGVTDRRVRRALGAPDQSSQARRHQQKAPLREAARGDKQILCNIVSAEGARGPDPRSLNEPARRRFAIFG